MSAIINMVIKMLIINNVKVPLECTNYKTAIANKLKIQENDITSFKIVKKAIDSRNKNDVFFICNFVIEVSNKVIKKVLKSKDIKPHKEYKYNIKKVNTNEKIIIVGTGPAGLFCAYTLALSGIKPIVIERGEDVDNRITSVSNFFKEGKLNTESNLQYGEGGAGTFSDGKLTTNINDERIEFIKNTFVNFGATEDIKYLSKPHIGSDILVKVVKNMREEIIKLGGKVFFNTRLTNIIVDKNKIKKIEVQKKDTLETWNCDRLILACGHSSKDTIKMLYEKDVLIEQKPFSMGVRIEHLQEEINKSQYGEKFYKHPALPPADYKLATHLPNGRSLYTFCMCPGGMVVASSSEPETIVTNGMSNYKRDEKNANSALLVNVLTNDYENSHPLAGLYFQEKYEKLAYSLTNSYKAPCTLLKDFLNDSVSNKFGKVQPSYSPGVQFALIKNCLPDFVSETIKLGIVEMGKKIKGFDDEDSILTAIESRSSSPVRIVRNDKYQTNIVNLYPIGEGSGYSSGITTSALDGIKCAESLLNNL